MRKNTHRGFTLIELLAVIVIVGILVGIVVGVGGNIRKKAAEARAKAEISGIELALERYKTDNGDYPEATNISIPTSNYDGNASGNAYLGASRVLFAELTGTTTFENSSGGQNPATDTVYFEVKSSQVGDAQGTSYFIDPFGYAYGYVYHAAGPTKSFYNEVVPDIWSTAGQTGATGSATNVYERWVTNWGSR